MVVNRNIQSCLLTYFLIGFLFIFSFSCREPENEPRPKKKKTVESVSSLAALPLEVSHPPDNPSTPEKTALGRLLFFDPILSGNRDVSCATCHRPDFSFAEFLETSRGVKGTHIPFVKRNSQTVLNTAFNGIANEGVYDPKQAPMFWDSRALSLEEQALKPIITVEEMMGGNYKENDIMGEILNRLQGIPEYRRLFKTAFPEEIDPIHEETLAKALATYERTLIANNSRFDQYMRGDEEALSLNEKEGLRLFLKSGCAKCHNGPMLSDFKLHTLGAPDTQNWGVSDSGINKDYAFRTPTLRNLSYTAPYMHSGKIKTLKGVLEFYEDISGGKQTNPNVPPHMTDSLVREMDVDFRDISLIVEFLTTLNDIKFDKTVPEKVPSGLPVGGED